MRNRSDVLLHLRGGDSQDWDNSNGQLLLLPVEVRPTSFIVHSGKPGLLSPALDVQWGIRGLQYLISFCDTGCKGLGDYILVLFTAEVSQEPGVDCVACYTVFISYLLEGSAFGVVLEGVFNPFGIYGEDGEELAVITAFMSRFRTRL